VLLLLLLLLPPFTAFRTSLPCNLKVTATAGEGRHDTAPWSGHYTQSGSRTRATQPLETKTRRLNTNIPWTEPSNNKALLHRRCVQSSDRSPPLHPHSPTHLHFLTLLSTYPHTYQSTPPSLDPHDILVSCAFDCGRLEHLSSQLNSPTSLSQILANRHRGDLPFRHVVPRPERLPTASRAGIAISPSPRRRR